MNNKQVRFQDSRVRILVMLMRLLAIIIIGLLVFGTIIYFYDNLVTAYQVIKFGHKPINRVLVHNLALLTAIIVGLGVLIESAPVIWRTLAYWGSVIDNGLRYVTYRKAYSLKTINAKLFDTEQLINNTNITLQSLFIAQQQIDNQVLDELTLNTKKIKDGCDTINQLLQDYKTFDAISEHKQKLANKHLQTLVSANLELCVKLKLTKSKFLNN